MLRVRTRHDLEHLVTHRLRFRRGGKSSFQLWYDEHECLCESAAQDACVRYRTFRGDDLVSAYRRRLVSYSGAEAQVHYVRL